MFCYFKCLKHLIYAKFIGCRKVAEKLPNRLIIKENKYIMLFKVINLFVENEFIELKSELTKEIKKEIVAFANSICQF